MNTKTKPLSANNILEVNKQILEIKKKIQLSEGQRKALFEECETQRKINSDQINKLKNEVSELVTSLRDSCSTSAKYRVKPKSADLEKVIGPVDDKNCTQAKELLELQIIDKTKQLDIVNYQIKLRRRYLAKLGNEYQELKSEKAKKELQEKVETPLKRNISELQNNIHSVKVQWREALLINERYLNIKKTLLEDAARYEFNIKCAENHLKIQQNDIERLKKIAEEATKMRGSARSALLYQEKVALKAALERDRQAIEGKRLVEEGRQELEKLEKRIFSSGKTAIRPELDRDEDNEDDLIEDEAETPVHPIEEVAEVFEKLKETTGASSTEEVLEKFTSQKETNQRLAQLRATSEEQKKKLEKRQEALDNELEKYKYAETKDAEMNVEEVEKIHKLIDAQQEKSLEFEEKAKKTEKIIQSISLCLQELHRLVSPLQPHDGDPLAMLATVEKKLKEAMEKVTEEVAESEIVENAEIDEEKWLPYAYSGLVRQTPVLQSGASPIPPLPTASEDEEEVPTRGFLKRQAQLVIDAKSRRKNLKMQLPRRK